MEPQEKIWKGESGKGFFLEYLTKAHSKALVPYDKVSGFSIQSQYFANKTLFRFPLRCKPSKLSNETYNIEKVRELLQVLEAEAKYLLLFLRSVCSIEVIEISEFNRKTIFNVSVSSRDALTYHQQQQSLVQRVETTFKSSFIKRIIEEKCQFQVETYNGTTIEKHEWIVIHRVGSEDPEVLALAEEQRVLPLVGTAFEVSQSQDNFGGRMFCFLPLPTEDRAPFCVHVNGTFAVSSNRRSLKWESQERQDDSEATWNKYLVEKCIPECYMKLIEEVVRIPNIKPEIVYNCWPVVSRVRSTPWEGMLKVLYEKLLYSKSVVYTNVDGGMWISLMNSVFIPKGKTIPMCVKQALILSRTNIVELSLNQWFAVESYCSIIVQTITPSLVRRVLKSNPDSYRNQSYENKCAILQYCLSDREFPELAGLELIPLANYSFGTFVNVGAYFRLHQNFYVCCHNIHHDLLPGLDHIMVDLLSSDQGTHSSLVDVARCGGTQLTLLTEQIVANLLPQSKSHTWSQDQLERFWKWLQGYNLKTFVNSIIFPVKNSSGLVTIQSLSKQSNLVYISQYTRLHLPLRQALEKYGVKFACVSDFSYLTHRQLHNYIYQFEVGDVLDALPSYGINAVHLTDDQCLAMQTFLSGAHKSIQNISRINKICDLRIFSVVQNNDTRYSINQLKTREMGNKALVQSDGFFFRTDLLPNQPMIINEGQNFLKHISGHITMINGIECLGMVVFPCIRKGCMYDKNIYALMKSVLDNLQTFIQRYPHWRSSFINDLSSLAFVSVESGERKPPSSLFDPKYDLLVELYKGEAVFPSDQFVNYTNELRLCGLKGPNSVTATDIYQVVCSIQSKRYLNESLVQCNEVTYCRAKGVFRFLTEYPHLLQQQVMTGSGWYTSQKPLAVAIAEYAKSNAILPIASVPPPDYPSCLTWKGSKYSNSLAIFNSENVLVLSGAVHSYSIQTHPRIIGSEAVYIENLPSLICRQLTNSNNDLADAVVMHFKHVLDNEVDIETEILEQIAIQTYEFLSSCSHSKIKLNSIDEWVWVDSCSTFVKPDICALSANPYFRNSLEPFVYILPKKLAKYEKLLCKFGVKEYVTSEQILFILESIKERTTDISSSDAWLMIKSILEWVVETQYQSGDLLIPIEGDGTFPELHPADEVSYTDNEMLLEIAETSDEDYKLIHHNVGHLAPQLGLTPLSDQLDITEEVFQDAGQHEPLTTRLRNILKEYKDGLTIIKEMIQNADDAEASEVNILYDTRNHTTDKLLFKGMAESHGPALVVHNNAIFTNEDFANITKLAGATKKDKPLKIGKFGVGFCSVYHITDVPSFVSNDWLYIFDPTLQHLKGIVKNENQPGKRVKYSSKFLSSTKQLAPYKGLFGFDTSKLTYSGTMFRFPFRKYSSEISSTIYNKEVMKTLEHDLVENGKDLLLFLNHVKKITFQTINQGETVPTEVITIRKDDCNDNIIKLETISSEMHVSREEFWLICSEEKKLYQKYDKQEQIGICSVACKLSVTSGQYTVIPINGSVFCFLPLPVPSTGLPVHVSANFAVMSNRSGIWTSASSTTPSDAREWWNQKLMETVIPAAYCKILNSLKYLCEKGELLDYDFYILFPLSEKLSAKYPWESMIKYLYTVLLNKNMFYSKSLGAWYTLSESRILSPRVLAVNSTVVPECVIGAVNVLKLPVVYLPQMYLCQLVSILRDKLNTFEQIEFCNTFFTMIECFEKDFELRNEVLLNMFITAASEVATSNQSELINILKNNPCVPCTPDGRQVKQASNLISPTSDLSYLFDKDSDMFPIECFSGRSSVHQVMLQIGLLTFHLPWNIVLECANSIESVYEVDSVKALKRVKVLIKSMKQNIETEKSQLSFHHSRKDKVNTDVVQLSKVKFIPVATKPDGYFLSWKGENITLSSPCELFYPTPSVGVFVHENIKRECCLLGTQKIIANSLSLDKGGCGTIPQSVLSTLGFQIKPSLDDVLSNYLYLIEQYNSEVLKGDEKLKFIESICRMTYEYFSNEIERQRTTLLSIARSQKVEQEEKTEAEVILCEFHDKPFIWSGNCFVNPENIALKWKENGPYLFEMPSILSQRKTLIETLGINEKFDINKLLNTLKEMHVEFGKSKLPENLHRVIDAIISELNIQSPNKLKDVNVLEIVLPSSLYSLYLSYDLSINDSPWLPANDDCVIVHSLLKRDVAIALGVKPVRSQFLEKYINEGSEFGGVPFGQSEKLTQRIENILRNYPLDVTLIKELLQNADDAKASKMCIMLDKRTHGYEKVPSKEWKELQGPAVLVWNNEDFTEKDLKGIQKLGLGSKSDDTESIGQFGIGFNVVYHITDCPSFITRGNTLCVFDPHCKYVPGANEMNPGRRYDKLENTFWDSMSDLKDAYLQNKPMNNQPADLNKGSLFRLPLRCTKDQVEKSKIIEDKIMTLPIASTNIERKIDEWVPQIKDALVFLNHITEFSYYVIDRYGFHLKAEYKVTLDPNAINRRAELFNALGNFKRTKQPTVVNYQLHIETREHRNSIPVISRPSVELEYKTSKEEWLVQQGVGDLDKDKKSQKWRYINKVLPKHGIAAPFNVSAFKGMIFCFLPLPIPSGLPVHINGQFVLNDNRRSLWAGDTEGQDEKNEWNDQLFEAIASSYVHFLIDICGYFVKDEEYEDKDAFYSALNQYYGLYPYWNTDKKDKQKPLEKNCLKLAQLVFEKLWCDNPHILATEIFLKDGKKKSIKVEWNPLKNEESPIEQVYFQPSRINRKTIMSILRRIKLKMTCAPHILYKHLVTEEYEPSIATPESVFQFYCAFYQHIFMHGIPCPIEQSPFETVDKFCEFIKYLLVNIHDSLEQNFPESPWGYPLLLTADEVVRCFDEHNKTIKTKFLHLFPKSLHSFLHKDCLSLEIPTTCFCQSTEVAFEIINSLLKSNYPHELMQEKCDNSNDSLLDGEKLNSLWECLSCDEDQLLHKHLWQVLNQWALIPSTNKQLYSTKSEVLPVVNNEEALSYGVVEEKAFKILLQLGLPELDVSVFVSDVTRQAVIKCCPKITDHNRVLTILYHLHQEQNIFQNLSSKSNDDEHILSYLKRTDFVHCSAYSNQIKALPLFKSIEGKLTDLLDKNVYLWPSFGFCDAGYTKWAPPDSVVFLEFYGGWRNLTSDFTMIGSSLDEKVIYMDLIFPNFAKLTSEERRSHLQYIKDNIYPSAKHDSAYAGTRKSHMSKRGFIALNFIHSLNNLPCIECPQTNQLKAVKEFSDHTIPILSIFSHKFIFVGDDYRDDDWMEFFRDLGLKKKLTIDEFISFCSDISMGHHKNLKEASKILLKYLFEEGRDWDEYYLRQIGDISFALVAELPSLTWIQSSCSPPHWVKGVDVGLTKLNQAVVIKYSTLIWTVKPVVLIPDISIADQERDLFLSWLQLTTTPTPNDVICNLINISKSDLSNPEYFHQSNPQFTCKVPCTKANVVNIVAKSVEFLQNNFADCKDMLSRLCERSFIPVSAKPNNPMSNPIEVVLVKPVEVVKHFFSAEEKHLTPYINELPSSLQYFDDILQTIGVLESVELVHLQHLFEVLYAKYEEKTIDPNALETIRCGVEKLAILTSKDDYNKKEAAEVLKPLYLPTKTGSNWCLKLSTDLVFADSSRYRTEDLKKLNLIGTSFSLFQIPPDSRVQVHQQQAFRTRSLNISLVSVDTKDSKLVKFKKEKNLCLSLPKRVRPIGLSLCTSERRLPIGTELHDNNIVALLLMQMKKFIQQLRDVLPNMLKHHLPHLPNSTNFISNLMDILESFEVSVIKGLQASMVINNVQIGTLTSPKFVLEKSDDSHYNIFLSDSVSPEDYFWFELSRFLLMELAKRLDCKSLTDLFPMTEAIKQCLQVQSKSSIQALGESYNVELCLTDADDFEEEEEDQLYPKLGKNLPEEFVCRLDNSIRNIFRPQEWVGYEISEQNFVWAIILYPETDKEGLMSRSENLLKKYRILVSEDNNEGIVVSVLDLYKIMTEELTKGEEFSEEKELMPVCESSGGVLVRNVGRDSQASRRMKTAICEELKLIWQLPNEEKRKAIKRMYLKYHPDKASANQQTNYNEAFKFLLRQIERLKEGKPLEDPDEVAEEDRQVSETSREWSQFYSQWNTYVPRYSRRSSSGESRATGRDAYSGGGGMPYDWQSRPSTQEADRWLRQAQSDCEVMRTVKREMDTLSICQVIFLAHEVVEKSLKAGMYALVGLNPSSLTNHELCCHARSICSQRPAGYSLNGQGRMNVSLVTIATNISHYYLDSRYPNRHQEFLAPVDVYSLVDAEEAADYAEMVIEFITRIVMN